MGVIDFLNSWVWSIVLVSPLSKTELFCSSLIFQHCRQYWERERKHTHTHTHRKKERQSYWIFIVLLLVHIFCWRSREMECAAAAAAAASECRTAASPMKKTGSVVMMMKVVICVVLLVLVLLVPSSNGQYSQAVLLAQRTGFHFQPIKNWMNGKEQHPHPRPSPEKKRKEAEVLGKSINFKSTWFCMGRSNFQDRNNSWCQGWVCRLELLFWLQCCCFSAKERKKERIGGAQEEFIGECHELWLH